ALSGMVVAHSSYATLSLSGGILSLILIPVVIWAHKGKKERMLNINKEF
ncbi:MFS transporter, partial [Priestia megaterium]|nr:MFS transporter [Priestia megaterium]